MKTKFLVVAQSIAEKIKGAENRLHKIIGEGHLSNRTQGTHQPIQPTTSVDKHQKAYVPKAEQHPSDII
jgi:hypothetical protein